MSEVLLLAKLRRKARKQGYVIRKFHGVHPVNNFGGYMILDRRLKIIAGERYNLFLSDIEAFINKMN